MIEIGVKQKLTVINMVDFGVYLGQPGHEEKVLLPIKQVPENTKPGDEIIVFIYRDSEDRLIATVREPRMQLGEIAPLRTVEINDIGAFFDWGLEKDLLVPYKEQLFAPEVGREYLVALYVDKSSRLAATMKVYHYLERGTSYVKDDMVRGTVYEILEDMGAFVAVDDRFSALIPTRELYGEIRVGDVVTARVTSVKEDGKLDLSVREKAYLQIGKDAERLIEILESYDGVLPFTDKASPDVIRRETGMSKNEFKRAVGNLLKNGKIVIKPDVIRLV